MPIFNRLKKLLTPEKTAPRPSAPRDPARLTEQPKDLLTDYGSVRYAPYEDVEIYGATPQTKDTVTTSGAFAVKDTRHRELPQGGQGSVFIPNGTKGQVRSVGKDTVMVSIPSLGIFHMKKEDVWPVGSLRPEQKRWGQQMTISGPTPSGTVVTPDELAPNPTLVAPEGTPSQPMLRLRSIAYQRYRADYEGHKIKINGEQLVDHGSYEKGKRQRRKTRWAITVDGDEVGYANTLREAKEVALGACGIRVPGIEPGKQAYKTHEANQTHTRTSDVTQDLSRRQAAGLVDLKGLDEEIASTVAQEVFRSLQHSQVVETVADEAAAKLSTLSRATLSQLLKSSDLLSTADAQARFSRVKLKFYSNVDPEYRAAFDPAGPQVEVYLGTIVSELTRAGKQRWGQVLEAFRRSLTHELRHAADWAYSADSFGGKPGLSEEAVGRTPAYVNTPTELKSLAGDVASKIFRAIGDEATSMSGKDIAAWAERLSPSIMTNLLEDNKKDFLIRVVKELERLSGRTATLVRSGEDEGGEASRRRAQVAVAVVLPDSKTRSTIVGHYKTSQKDPHLRFLGKVKEFEVWLVDGTMIRDFIDIDFTSGSNPARNPYIPRGEVWVELVPHTRDLVSTAVHEVHEAELMVQGWSYEEAHDRAARLEAVFREQHGESFDDQPLDLPAVVETFLKEYEKTSPDELIPYGGHKPLRRDTLMSGRESVDTPGSSKTVVASIIDECPAENVTKVAAESPIVSVVMWGAEPQAMSQVKWLDAVLPSEIAKTQSGTSDDPEMTWPDDGSKDDKTAGSIKWHSLNIILEAPGGKRRHKDQYLLPEWRGIGYFEGLTDRTDPDESDLDVIVGGGDLDDCPVFLAIQKEEGEDRMRQFKVFLGFSNIAQAEGAYSVVFNRKSLGGLWTLPSKRFRKTVLPRITKNAIRTRTRLSEDDSVLNEDATNQSCWSPVGHFFTRLASCMPRTAARLTEVNPEHIEPPHGPKNMSKRERLVQSMITGGWQGRPVLAYFSGGQIQALTGSHRISAARLARLPSIPILLIEDSDFPDDEAYSMLDDATDNADRVRALEAVGGDPLSLMLTELQEKHKLNTSKWRRTSATVVEWN